jgi:hypothetical protein
MHLLTEHMSTHIVGGVSSIPDVNSVRKTVVRIRVMNDDGVWKVYTMNILYKVNLKRC